MVCARADIPPDERSCDRTRCSIKLQVWLYTAFSPMQPGLPPIDADPQRAEARLHPAASHPLPCDPALPAEYLGSPDLGSLAVRGPYACYTTRVDDAGSSGT